MGKNLKKIKKVNPKAKGYQELFQYDDQYIVISTVAELQDSWRNETDELIANVVGGLGGYAVDGEESMAFPSDSEGNIIAWSEVDYTTGNNSRERLIEKLKNK